MARPFTQKVKTAFALPEDNCVDVYANDLGFLTVHEDGKIIGYNVLAGGGMESASAAKTFSALAKRLCFVSPEDVIDIAVAIVKVQRDHETARSKSCPLKIHHSQHGH